MLACKSSSSVAIRCASIASALKLAYPFAPPAGEEAGAAGTEAAPSVLVGAGGVADTAAAVSDEPFVVGLRGGFEEAAKTASISSKAFFLFCEARAAEEGNFAGELVVGVAGGLWAGTELFEPRIVLLPVAASDALEAEETMVEESRGEGEEAPTTVRERGEACELLLVLVRGRAADEV